MLQRHGLHVAGGVDQPQRHAVRRQSGDEHRERRGEASTGTRPPTTSSPARSTGRCRDARRAVSATSEPAPASSTIISRSPDSASSPRSQRSGSVGQPGGQADEHQALGGEGGGRGRSRGAAATRQATTGHGRGMRGRACLECADDAVAARALGGPARRDRVEPRRPAHLDHRPAAHRRRRGGRGLAAGWPARLRPGADQPAPTGPRDGRAGRLPRAEVDDDLVEWAYGDYEGVTTEEIRETVPGWTVWTHPTPGARPPTRSARGSTAWSRRRPTARAGRWSSATATRCGCSPPAGRQPVAEGRFFRLDTATVSVLGFERETPVCCAGTAEGRPPARPLTRGGRATTVDPCPWPPDVPAARCRSPRTTTGTAGSAPTHGLVVPLWRPATASYAGVRRAPRRWPTASRRTCRGR